MAMFNQSTRTFQQVVQEVADAAGASGQDTQTTRAGRSVNASIKYFHAKTKWRFLQSEANPILVVAPFGVTGVSASAGQTSALAPSGAGFKVDDWIQMSGLIQGTRVTAVATAAGPVTAIHFNTTVSASIGTGVQVVSATANRDFYDLPSDFRSVYSFRLLVANKPLQHANRRIYDRTRTDEYQPSTPEAYDDFSFGQKGKVRLLPSPNAEDIIELRYYRAMATASATGVTSNFDVPADYDDYFIAWAKWHYLTDKSEGGGQQAETWLAFAKEGLQIISSDMNFQPDSTVIFTPGHTYGQISPNDVRFTYDRFDH